MKITDAELEDFKDRWTKECVEWGEIRDAMIAREPEVSAYHVTAEQARRMRERGETSVLLGPVAKALGLSPRVTLYSVPAGGDGAHRPREDEPVSTDEILSTIAGYPRDAIKEIRDACDRILGAHDSAPSLPVRCRIGWAHGTWQCRASGCGASGQTAQPGRLVDCAGRTISVDDLPAQAQPYSPGATCLFDRETPKP